MPNKKAISTVRTYYFKVFKNWPLDVSLDDLSITSICGKQCKEIIDAAERFIELCEKAGGKLPSTEIFILAAVQDHINLLWKG